MLHHSKFFDLCNQSLTGACLSSPSWKVSMTNLHETEPKAQIDVTGWLFVAAVAVIVVIAATVVIHNVNDTLLASAPLAPSS